jgi:hypothetical protein
MLTEEVPRIRASFALSTAGNYVRGSFVVTPFPHVVRERRLPLRLVPFWPNRCLFVTWLAFTAPCFRCARHEKGLISARSIGGLDTRDKLKSTFRIIFRRLANIASHLLTEKYINDPFFQPVSIKACASVISPSFFAITSTTNSGTDMKSTIEHRVASPTQDPRA